MSLDKWSDFKVSVGIQGIDRDVRVLDEVFKSTFQISNEGDGGNRAREKVSKVLSCLLLAAFGGRIAAGAVESALLPINEKTHI